MNPKMIHHRNWEKTEDSLRWLFVQSWLNVCNSVMVTFVSLLPQCDSGNRDLGPRNFLVLRKLFRFCRLWLNESEWRNTGNHKPSNKLAGDPDWQLFYPFRASAAGLRSTLTICGTSELAVDYETKVHKRKVNPNLGSSNSETYKVVIRPWKLITFVNDILFYDEHNIWWDKTVLRKQKSSKKL